MTFRVRNIVYKRSLSATILSCSFVCLYITVAMMKSFLYSLKSSASKSTMSTPQGPEYPMHQSHALTVIELFQSQGCSSCPPANSNVLKLAEDPNLLILTYDVTYWDRLGWKDTFGNSANDKRQWEYARALSRKNVFTPQVCSILRHAGTSSAYTYQPIGHCQWGS